MWQLRFNAIRLCLKQIILSKKRKYQQKLTCSLPLCFSAVFPFNIHWWCNVEGAPTVIGKTCQVILESHSSEKIKRIKNGPQFCPNSRASNGQHCSNSVWTNVPQAKISTAVSHPLSNGQNTGFVDSLRLISEHHGTLLIWLTMQHLEAVCHPSAENHSTQTSPCSSEADFFFCNAKS